MKKNSIDYNIVKTYSNGVRAGNVARHKEPKKTTGIQQSWFPKNWTDSTIKRAGQTVSRGSRLDDGQFKVGYYCNVEVVIVRTKGEIATIFPLNIQKNKRGEILNECKKSKKFDKRKSK